MAEFVCKVGDEAGRIFQQVETAQNEGEARQKLTERGFYVFSVRHNFDVLGQFTRANANQKIRINDFLIFNQQFNTLIKAGLPILKALDLLAERAAAEKLRPVLQDVRQRVREGALLSEALTAQGSFNPVYVTAVTAGERSGNLTGVLDQYINYLRTSTGFRSRLVTSLIYPAILILAVVFIMLYLVNYAMPQFASLYHDLGVPLPAITTMMLNMSLVLRNYVLAVVIVLVVGGAAAFLWSRTERGGLVIDSLKPKIPVLGDIWLKAQIAQFVRTLATLLAGGTPLVSALQTCAFALNSKLLSTSITQAAERVKEGQSLHSALAATGLMPALSIEMIEVGEASGALAPMLTSVADFYEEEVSTRLQRTLIWIQPAILGVMAVVIGFILISLYLPLFSLQIGAAGG